MKTDKNYKIFRVELEKHRKYVWPKKIVMQYIYAKNDEDAYKQLKNYKKTANKEYTYYVEPFTYYFTEDGKKHDIDLFVDEFKSKGPWYKRLFEDIMFNIEYYFKTKPKDIYFYIKDFIYFLKNKHEKWESWNVDRALLKTLLFNIKKLRNNKYSLSWKMIDKAIVEKYGNEPDFNFKAYQKKYAYGPSDEISELAIKLEKEMFDKLIQDINEYFYYVDYYNDYIDETNKELVELDKRLRPTLPLIKGSYDRYDYKKLNDMALKRWNRIWETVRIYGLEFVD
jgi:hypothetical protein